jgi:Family of unknown function (DUF6893)
MQAIGWTATVIVGLVVLGGLVLGVRSIPDARRYMRIRRM